MILMAIRSIIFHKISRFQEDAPSEIKLFQGETQLTADHEGLFSQLKKNFQFKSGKLFGQFDPDIGSSPFQSWLKEFNSKKISFEKLAQLFIENFKELVDKTSEEIDSTIALIHEDRADGERFYIFALESISGLSINSHLELDTTEYLSPSKLDLAIRIDLESAWLDDNDEPFLCLVKARSSGKIGEAFMQACSFKNNVDCAKETETLMKVLSGYSKQVPQDEAANVHKKAYEFCVEQQQLGEAVPLKALSNYVNDKEPEQFAEYAQQFAQLDSSQNLRPDTRKLKHLVRISGKGNGLSLSFSSDLMQQTILFDEQSDTLTITAIPKSLKKQILEHLNASKKDNS
ncbi:MAG: nucleoid-associated protein [Oleiphilaceae bacterium]|jgi:nucleoid-associated protein